MKMHVKLTHPCGLVETAGVCGMKWRGVVWVKHGWNGRRSVCHANPVGHAPCRHRYRSKQLKRKVIQITNYEYYKVK